MRPCNQIQIRVIETLIFVRELDVVKTNFLLHSFIKNDLRVIKFAGIFAVNFKAFEPGLNVITSHFPPRDVEQDEAISDGNSLYPISHVSFILI